MPPPMHAVVALVALLSPAVGQGCDPMNMCVDSGQVLNTTEGWFACLVPNLDDLTYADMPRPVEELTKDIRDQCSSRDGDITILSCYTMAQWTLQLSEVFKCGFIAQFPQCCIASNAPPPRPPPTDQDCDPYDMCADMHGISQENVWRSCRWQDGHEEPMLALDEMVSEYKCAQEGGVLLPERYSCSDMAIHTALESEAGRITMDEVCAFKALEPYCCSCGDMGFCEGEMLSMEANLVDCHNSSDADHILMAMHVVDLEAHWECTAQGGVYDIIRSFSCGDVQQHLSYQEDMPEFMLCDILARYRPVCCGKGGGDGNGGGCAHMSQADLSRARMEGFVPSTCRTG